MILPDPDQRLGTSNRPFSPNESRDLKKNGCHSPVYIQFICNFFVRS